MPFINSLYPAIPDARAAVYGTESYPDLNGIVLFCQMPYGVFINAQFHGLPPISKSNPNRFMGFHIHENGNCSLDENQELAFTGNHYNPDTQLHPCHRGDLPPVLNCNGYAWQSFLTDAFRVEEIIGRSIVLHALPDDFKTQPSGDSGSKIGCGIISAGQL